MRRNGPACNRSQLVKRLRATLVLFSLLLIAVNAATQAGGPLHPHAQPQQPTADQPATGEPPIAEYARGSTLMEAIRFPMGWPEPEPPLPELPAQITIPAKQHIPVFLDTQLSTRTSKPGQIVTFRTSYSLLLGDGLEVPPETEILGHIVDVKRPGHYGKQGELHIAVDRMHLDPDAGVNLEAHLNSTGMKGQGRLTADGTGSTDPSGVVMGSVQGTLLGAAIGGAKGAGIGAGAGAALAVLILMSPRGQDVYLEPGMRFTVILDQPAYLSGAAVYAAQQQFLKNPGPPTVEPDSQNDGLPKLKRRRPPHH